MTGRVLVVDDHPEVLRLMVETLEATGLTVVGVGSVTEAKALPGPWDLLVIDFGLPNGDGMEIAVAYPNVPTLFVSGRPNADLLKPFTARQLCEAVEARLSMSHR